MPFAGDSDGVGVGVEVSDGVGVAVGSIAPEVGSLEVSKGVAVGDGFTDSDGVGKLYLMLPPTPEVPPPEGGGVGFGVGFLVIAGTGVGVLLGDDSGEAFWLPDRNGFQTTSFANTSAERASPNASPYFPSAYAFLA